MAGSKSDDKDGAPDPERRKFIANACMFGGLAASHLMAGGLAVIYLQPVKHDRKRRLFVGLRSEIPPGSSISFRIPSGQAVNVVNSTGGFLALSDVCPHLGCKVHWEPQAKEFICPCHDGHFDAKGLPVSGPPAEMKAPLPRFDVVEEGDRIFLELAVTT